MPYGGYKIKDINYILAKGIPFINYTMNRNDIISELRSYITEKLFRNGVPADFTNDTKLVSTRMLDSIIVLGLINHLEEKYNIELEAHEVNVDNLDTINIMADFLSEKLAK